MSKKKNRKYKALMIAEATLKISVSTLIIGMIGKWAFSNIDGLKDINHDDIKRFLVNGPTIEEQDENYVEEEEISDELTQEETQEEIQEESAPQEAVNTLPYPDIIPENDFEREPIDISEIDVDIPAIDWEYVNEVNEDANGWLYLPGVGTKDGLNLPVVQGDDNEYYLSHDIEGNEDSKGTLFVDYRNNPLDSGTQELSDVTCIFGHNMKSGSMFASICNYKSQTFYDRHPYGIMMAENGDIYKIDYFAGVIVDGMDNRNIYASDFIDESQFNAYFDNIVSNSTFQSDCKVEFGDKIVVFQTCSYEYNSATFLLYGRLTKVLINDQEVQNTLGR